MRETMGVWIAGQINFWKFHVTLPEGTTCVTTEPAIEPAFLRRLPVVEPVCPAKEPILVLQPLSSPLVTTLVT